MNTLIPASAEHGTYNKGRNPLASTNAMFRGFAIQLMDNGQRNMFFSGGKMNIAIL